MKPDFQFHPMKAERNAINGHFATTPWRPLQTRKIYRCLKNYQAGDG
jgi:hypothetical protein